MKFKHFILLSSLIFSASAETIDNKVIIKEGGMVEKSISNTSDVQLISTDSFFDNEPNQNESTINSNTQYFSVKQGKIVSGRVHFLKTDWNNITGVSNENWFSVAFGYKSVCQKIYEQNDFDSIKSDVISIGLIKDYKQICNEIINLTNEEEAKNYFLNNFTPYIIHDNQTSTNVGLFTGYYYPTLHASKVKTAKYKYPIYKKPPELNNKKYYTRKEINDGILANRGLEIFWVDDFVDLYYLHIQGSGMLEMEDGEYIHIKFAAKNNQPYTSLGKYMLEKGFVRSESEIKQFLHSNHDIAQDILGINKSYIFFEENTTENVIGAHGSFLVDGRSLAIDNHYIPHGSLLFIETPLYTKTMFAQDSGSAIKSPIRGDIFIGKGENAGKIAKQTHYQGIMYIMVHKSHNIQPL